VAPSRSRRRQHRRRRGAARATASGGRAGAGRPCGPQGGAATSRNGL